MVKNRPVPFVDRVCVEPCCRSGFQVALPCQVMRQHAPFELTEAFQIGVPSQLGSMNFLLPWLRLRRFG